VEDGRQTAENKTQAPFARWTSVPFRDYDRTFRGLKNKRHNAELRRRWADGLGQISQRLTSRAWDELGLQPEGDLLEREWGDLSVERGRAVVPLRGHGFSALTLER
jgi:hypothetical protein